MVDVRKPAIRPFALEGNSGPARAALRVTKNGRMAQTPHPFPPDHPRIVRDFCENQTEINTGVHPTAKEAVAELAAVNQMLIKHISVSGESLWTNTNPPPIADEDEIVPARFTGPLSGKSAYRAYLAGKYGKRLMAYCGIHVNFSFGERLVSAAGVDRDELYLHVAAQCVKWGWAIVALTAASPAGQYASVRCSEKGYWNRFVPILDFSSAKAYAKSIARYVQDGLLAAPSELYYPIRLKPRGLNNLLTLAKEVVAAEKEVEVVHLFMLGCAAQKHETLSAAKQEESVGWFKAAARLDFDWSAVGELLERMGEFFAGSAGWSVAVQRILAFEAEKIYSPGKRYARMEACHV